MPSLFDNYFCFIAVCWSMKYTVNHRSY